MPSYSVQNFVGTKIMGSFLENNDNLTWEAINRNTVMLNKYFSSNVTWCHTCHVRVTLINGKVDQIPNFETQIFTGSNYTRRESPGRRLKKIDLNLDCYLPNQKAPFSSDQDSVQTWIKIHISIVTSFYYILYTYYMYILYFPHMV